MGEEKKYQVTYHRLVAGEVTSLDALWRERVRSAIEGKLTTLPEVYGKPLRNSLAGYRTLRVGDYRIVFEIKKKAIHIIAIQHRREGYIGVEKRR